MGVSNLPVVFTRPKNFVTILGHAQDFKGATEILREACKDTGVKFNSKNLRCFASAVRIVVDDRINAAFPCFLYEHKKLEVRGEKTKTLKPKLSLKLKSKTKTSSSVTEKPKAKGTR